MRILPGLSEGGLQDVRVRLRVLGVAGRGLHGDEVGDARLLENRRRFVFLRRRRDDQLEAFAVQQPEEITRAGCRPQRGEVPPKQPATRFRDARSLAALGVESDERGQQLVAAHADEGADLFERDDVPVLCQRSDPRARVGVIAVDECAIDVEQDDLQGVTGRMQWRCHSRSLIKYSAATIGKGRSFASLRPVNSFRDHE